jgi:hypothetical protein
MHPLPLLSTRAVHILPGESPGCVNLSGYVKQLRRFLRAAYYKRLRVPTAGLQSSGTSAITARPGLRMFEIKK